MTQQLDHIRAAYVELQSRVNLALRTQLGDAYQLEQQKNEVLSLASAASQVSTMTFIYIFLLICASVPDKE